jgi:hypothetical protein
MNPKLSGFLKDKTKVRKLFIILVVLIAAAAGCSAQNNIDLIGTWSVGKYYEMQNSEATWEFKSNKAFNILKLINDDDTKLRPDENGTWSIENNKLTIIITGEEINGKQQLFSKPQILKYIVSKDGSVIICSLVENTWEINESSLNLVLKKK